MSFYKRLEVLCKHRGMSVTALASELGFSSSSCSTWKKAKGLPRNSTIKRIADYFGVPTSYLLGESETACNDDCNTSESATNNLTEHETTLLDIFRKLDTINQARLLTYAADLMK